MPRPPARASAIALALLIVGVATGCADAPAALGRTPPEAAANADDLLSALAQRFGPLRRAPQLAAIRPKYVRASLVPSRVFDDPDLWSAASGRTRVLGVAGRMDGDRYLLALRPRIPVPDAPGESRQYLYLTQLDDDVYEWNSTAELAVGRVGARELLTSIERALGSMEGHGEAEVRAGWRLALPRTSAALGRLFSIDTLRLTPLRDGTTAIAMSIQAHADWTRERFPELSAYLEKYVLPSSFHLALVDHGGTTWMDARTTPNFLHLRFRLRDGRLAPLAGPARELPDSLVLQGELSMKVMLFTVGVSRLRADVVPVRESDEVGFALRFHEDPEWHLPPLTARMMRGSLRRPFAGQGILFRLAVQDAPNGGQTIASRTLNVDVQEGAIVRWLNGLGSAVMKDVTAKVEYQKDRFVADAFEAMRQDLGAGSARGAMVGQ